MNLINPSARSALGALGLVLLAAPELKANMIGINFVGGSTANGTPAGLGSRETSGWVAQNFWNNAYNAAGSLNPEGDDGGSMSIYYSGFVLSWSDSYGTRSTPIIDSGGNSRLMRGYLNSDNTVGGTISVNASGVPAALVNHGYAVIVYFDGDNGTADRVTKMTLSAPGWGTQTLFGLDKANVNFSGSFKQIPSSSTTDAGSATPNGNVAVFYGLHATSFSLAVSGGTASDLNARGALNAIQIVDGTWLPNQAPGVSLVSPTNNATLWACASFALTANASDVDGTISQVEFYQGNNLIGRSTRSPYQVQWKGDALGAYTFTAKATDDRGATTVSSPVTLNLGLPPLRQLVAYGMLTNGQCEICMNGQAGKNYAVLATTNLINWSNIGMMYSTNGLLQFRDSATQQYPRRFYRALQQ